MDRTDSNVEPATALGAARFVAAALGLAEDDPLLAADFVEVDADPAVITLAIELDSSAGTAAFLVYAYRLSAQGEDGRSGEERFRGDIATMTEAERRGAPGPRLVAHAADGGLGFVLATSPAFRLIMAGDPRPPDLRRIVGNSERGDLANRLMASLLGASAAATRWLAAVEAAGSSGRATPQETELALRLLDPSVVPPLMEAIRRLVDAAPPAPSSDVEGGPP